MLVGVVVYFSLAVNGINASYRATGAGIVMVRSFASAQFLVVFLPWYAPAPSISLRQTW